jgi:hypothetical protein
MPTRHGAIVGEHEPLAVDVLSWYTSDVVDRPRGGAEKVAPSVCLSGGKMSRLKPGGRVVRGLAFELAGASTSYSRSAHLICSHPAH